MDTKDFENLIEDIIKSIPNNFKNKIENLSIIIDDENIPKSSKSNPYDNKITLAIYHGVPNTKRHHGKPLFPDKIIIYKKAIESISNTENELIKNTRRVVLHELGHYFGLDEKRLSELGY